jgi:hypothetical protein
MKINDRPNATDSAGPAPVRCRRRRGRVRLPVCWPVAAVVLAAVSVAGCGGSSTSNGSVAHIKSSTTTNASTKSVGQPNALAFAQCMRKHGVPNYPDPNSSGQLQLGGVNPQSPAFQTAANECKSFGVGGTPRPITQTPQMQANGLRMASCMRSHGVANYPDGPITRNSGINENSPAFQRAFQNCRKYMSGAGQVPTAGGQVPVTGG